MTTDYIDQIAIRREAARAKCQAGMTDTPPPFQEGKWQWWAGESEDSMMRIGPCATRDQVISEAVQGGLGEWLDDSQDPPRRWNKFTILEAKQDPLRMADWIDADTLLDRADEAVLDSDRACREYDDGPFFDVTTEQEADLRCRLQRACDEWQIVHGLKFSANTFSASRNHEEICTDALRTTASEGGAA